MNKTALMAFVLLLLFSVTVPNAAYCQSPPPTDPYVYVLVWSYHYPLLLPAISTYKQDLENAGFSVEIIAWPNIPDNAEATRELLQNEASKHEIAGVLLVGDVPYAEYEIGNERFPCDLFYMDLDGNWTDSDSNGAYEKHGNGNGDLGPEIWVGRLWASTITGDEDELLINFFNKTHRFRTGELTLPRRALAYIDDPFVYHADDVNSSLRTMYGNETSLVIDPETTNATDYKNRLNDTLGYEWVHLEAHGNYEGHGFNTSKGWTYIYSSEILSIDPHVFFYNLLACDTADYRETDYIGGSYIFADTYGLLAVGSTKLGSMSNFNDFYGPIAKGKCIGQSFKEWFEKNGELGRDFYYGLTILGDPTLRTPRTYNQTRNVAVTNVTAGDSRYGLTEVYSGWDVTVNVALKNEGVFVETINLTVYYDNNTIEAQTVNLFPASDRILTFIWGTTSVHRGNYTIKAETSTVLNETGTDDNTMVDGTIRVRVPGDVNGDGKVSSGDLLELLIDLSLEKTGEEEPFSDINCDGKISSGDLLELLIILTLKP